MTFFGNRAFADVKDEARPGAGRVPRPYGWFLIEKGKHTQGERTWRSESCCHQPEATRSWKRGTGASLRCQREHALPTPGCQTRSLQNCDTINFRCSKPSVIRTWCRQPRHHFPAGSPAPALPGLHQAPSRVGIHKAPTTSLPCKSPSAAPTTLRSTFQSPFQARALLQPRPCGPLPHGRGSATSRALRSDLRVSSAALRAPPCCHLLVLRQMPAPWSSVPPYGAS